jgi:hypothetical protein
MSNEMLINLAFFDGDNLLCQGSIQCDVNDSTDVFESGEGHRFEIQHRFDEPACPVSIQCNFNGNGLYNVALQVGVHNSDDWESIDLGNIHTLGFRCHVA